MQFHDTLVTATAPDRQALLGMPVIREALAGRITRATYAAFLEQAYHHVKHTVPLLMACGARLPQRLEWLREAVAHYIAEESGHQEWVLADLAACGGDAEGVRRGGPGVATELMVAYAYDTIARGNPVGFFAMVFVLEGTSTALATQAAASIQRTLALPDQAFSYLTSHGHLDIEHVEFFRGLMNRLDDESDQTAVVHAARVFYRLYGDIFRNLPVADARREVA
jgi:pyrroloquinoline quinone (PQQ) biosynthesis protein C